MQLLTKDQRKTKGELYSKFYVIFLQENKLQILETIKMRLNLSIGTEMRTVVIPG